MPFDIFLSALLIGIIWAFVGQTNFIIALYSPSDYVPHYTSLTCFPKLCTGLFSTTFQPTFATISMISYCSSLLLPSLLCAQQQWSGSWVSGADVLITF